MVQKPIVINICVEFKVILKGEKNMKFNVAKARKEWRELTPEKRQKIAYAWKSLSLKDKKLIRITFPQFYRFLSIRTRHIKTVHGSLGQLQTLPKRGKQYEQMAFGELISFGQSQGLGWGWKDIRGGAEWLGRRGKDIKGGFEEAGRQTRGGLEWTGRRIKGAGKFIITAPFKVGGWLLSTAWGGVEEAIMPDFYKNLDENTKDIILYGGGFAVGVGIVYWATHRDKGDK